MEIRDKSDVRFVCWRGNWHAPCSPFHSEAVLRGNTWNQRREEEEVGGKCRQQRCPAWPSGRGVSLEHSDREGAPIAVRPTLQFHSPQDKIRTSRDFP